MSSPMSETISTVSFVDKTGKVIELSYEIKATQSSGSPNDDTYKYSNLLRQYPNLLNQYW